MAKFGIVMASTVRKHKRLDPGYYLSDRDEVEALERAKLSLERATATYWRRVRELAKKRAHLARARKEVL